MIDIIFVDIQSDGVLLKQQKVVPYAQYLAEIEVEKKRWERQEGIRALKYHETLKSEIAALKERIKELEGALEKIIHEIGVPQPGYIRPAANAYEIAKQALKVKP